MGPLQGPAVHTNQRFAPPVGKDFDGSPAEPAPAGAQRLQNGLLAGKACGQLGRTAAPIARLGRCEDSCQKVLAVTAEHFPDAPDRDDVDADADGRPTLRNADYACAAGAKPLAASSGLTSTTCRCSPSWRGERPKAKPRASVK